MMEGYKARENKKGLIFHWKGTNSFLKGKPSLNNDLLYIILHNTAIEIIKFMSFENKHWTITLTMKMVTKCILCAISQDKVQLHCMCRNLCEYSLTGQSSLCSFIKAINVIGHMEMSLLTPYVIMTYAHIFLSSLPQFLMCILHNNQTVY